MSSLIARRGAFEHRNPRLFVLFTTLYNARAYYPILAIFFTDLGLSLDQFVLLNFAWAAAIFLLEVPSGALADTLGRKKLLVTSAALMVLEMGLLLLAPKDGGPLLLILCFANRILSGASEAAASGADEAIAYDALPEADRDSQWDDVLATAMRWRAVGFLIAMSLGGLLYDPSWLESLTGHEISRSFTHRLPMALVFLQALGCLAIALRLEEVTTIHTERIGTRCARAFRLTLGTARHVFTSRPIAIVLFGGLLIDAVARNFATLNSAYYRLIDIPAWAFGFIGSFVAVGNWFVPAVAKRLNHRFPPLGVLSLSAAFLAVSLFLLAPAWPWLGLIPAVLLMTLLGFVGFTLSRFLHRHATSEQRATMLSVKGLAFNLGYGGYSLAFSLLLAGLGKTSDSALQEALWWQAGGITLILLLYFSWAARPRTSAKTLE
ncbi:MAG: MFS transporter [Verrucomicrobiales bacterium]